MWLGPLATGGWLLIPPLNAVCERGGRRKGELDWHILFDPELPENHGSLQDGRKQGIVHHQNNAAVIENERYTAARACHDGRDFT